MILARYLPLGRSAAILTLAIIFLLHPGNGYCQGVETTDAKQMFKQLVQVGDSLSENGKYKEAFETYTKALKIHRSWHTLNKRAQVSAKLKHWPEVINDLDRAISIDSDEPAMFELRACADEELGRFTDAFGDLVLARRLRAMAQSVSATPLPDPGCLWKMVQCYERIEKDLPNCALAKYNLGLLYFCLDQPQSCINEMREFLRSQSYEKTQVLARALCAICLRQEAHSTAAAELLNKDDAHSGGRDWPYSLVAYLRGQESEEDLLHSAGSFDNLVRARFYIALNNAQTHKSELARNHLQWIVNHGDPGMMEYTMAALQLKKLPH